MWNLGGEPYLCAGHGSGNRVVTKMVSELKLKKKIVTKLVYIYIYIVVTKHSDITFNYEIIVKLGLVLWSIRIRFVLSVMLEI